MSAPSLSEMRALLGLGSEVSDADVTAAYAAWLLHQAPGEAAPPVSLVQVKFQLRLENEDTEWDERLLDLIRDAQDLVEQHTNVLLTQRRITETFPAFGALRLRYWPIAQDPGLTVTYLDHAGTSRPASGRMLDQRRPATIAPATGSPWPCTASAADAVSVTYNAGYASPADIPGTITRAMLVLIRHWYENPGAVALGRSEAILPAAASLLRLHRLSRA